MVFSEHTMINSGEANMDMREATLKDPTKTCRMEGSNSLKLTNAMAANTPKTATNNPIIFTCQQYPEKLSTKTKQK